MDASLLLYIVGFTLSLSVFLFHHDIAALLWPLTIDSLQSQLTRGLLDNPWRLIITLGPQWRKPDPEHSTARHGHHWWMKKPSSMCFKKRQDLYLHNANESKKTKWVKVNACWWLARTVLKMLKDSILQLFTLKKTFYKHGKEERLT